MRESLKKTDELAQKKIEELKGLKKKIDNRQPVQEEEHSGVDEDIVKNWIIENTDKMLKNRDLRSDLMIQMG